MSQLRTLPLQEMIRTVVNTATEKLAAAEGTDDAAMRHALNGTQPESAEDDEEGDDGFTDPSYVEKLASACDFIAENVNNIEAPNRGVLGNVIAKMAGEEVPPAVVTPDQLSVMAAMGGKQKYKHDKPKGHDAAVSTAGTPEGTAGLPGGATQMQNDMDKAPGGNNSSVPTKTYPTAGVLHAGTKTAGLAALANSLAEKNAGVGSKAKGAVKRYIELMKGGKKTTFAGPGRNGSALGEILDKRPGNSAIGLKQNIGDARKSMATRAATGVVGAGGVAAALSGKKEKTAAEAARARILQKLAGEDVMKASISSSRSASPLVGGGELQVMEAPVVPSNPTDGSGYGNQQRTHVMGNEAAQNFTKADAKKPRAKELKEVLKTPAFDPGADSKLREQLRNAGSAGVKIAGANSKDLLKQAAASGLLNQETVNQYKELRKQAMMASPGSGGMTSVAGETAPKNPNVAKLKSMMAAKKATADDGSGSGEL